MVKPEIYNKRVEEVMSRMKLTVGPRDSLSEALGKMKKNQMREIPVIEKGKLKGLLTFRTLARRRKMPITSHVQNFMISPPRVNPNDRIYKVVERLITRDFSSLPVTHKADVLGMISRMDIIKLLGEDEEVRRMPVESVMNFAPTTIDGSMGIKKALNIIDLSGELGAAVIDGEGRFLGCVTTKELVAYLETPKHRPHTGDFQGEKVRSDRTVESLARMPETLSRSDAIGKAMDIMIGDSVDTIYVMDGNDLVGSLTEVDLLEIFMRGPSRSGPLIQVAGIEDIKLMDASELNSLMEKFIHKIEKFSPITAVTIRIKHHHHDSDEDKYTVIIKLSTRDSIIVREAYDWDLLVAVGEAFSHIEQQIKKDLERARDKVRKRS